MDINNFTISNSLKMLSFKNIIEKEEIYSLSPEEISEIKRFAGMGLKAMKEEDDILKSIKKGKVYIETIGKYDKVSCEVKLARIALKASTEGASLLGNMISSKLQNVSLQSTNNKELFVPLKAVYMSTLETIVSHKMGSVVIIAAYTALNAISRLGRMENSLIPALAIEIFITGIAEHMEENLKAGEIADFLYKEFTPALGLISINPYKVAFEAIAEGFSEPKSAVLSRIGNEILESIPGEEKDMVSLVIPIIEKLSIDENPLVSEIAETIDKYVKSLVSDKKKDEMVSLYKICFKELGNFDYNCLKDLAKGGAEMIDAMSKSECHLPEYIIAKIGKIYLDFIRKNINSKNWQIIFEIAAKVYPDDEDGITAVYLYKAALEAFAADEQNLVTVASFLNVGLKVIKELEGKNRGAQVTAARVFLDYYSDLYYFPAISSEIDEVFELSSDSENIVGKHLVLLNKLKCYCFVLEG